VIVRRIARPLMAGIFLAGGVDALRNPREKTGAAEKLNLAESEQVVKANAVAQIVGGAALATNRVPRLAALGLAASLVPTTLGGHRFWEESDRQARANQQMHFLKNVSILGGLLVAAVDTEGRESAARKVRRGGRQVAQATSAVLAPPAVAGRAARRGARVGGAVGVRVGKAGGRVRERLPV
jgi:uncharacterized membrane protein YphA (DoxX/SURF4 family)